MSDLERALLDAWQIVWPKLKADPSELARRLARRRRATLMKPLRAWCLAVRASDHRINPATARICPEDAAYQPCTQNRHIGVGDVYRAHDVTLDAKLLRRLCRGVRIRPGGQDWTEVAAMLGVHTECLRWGMRKGHFDVQYIRSWAGKWGQHPVPILSSERTFDPSSCRLFEPPDPVWDTSGRITPTSCPMTSNRRSSDGRCITETNKRIGPATPQAATLRRCPRIGW